MPVQAADFMKVANVLMGSDSKDEVFIRSAVSRAYYSLYHAALDAIGRKGKSLVKVDNAGDHASVIATLCSMGPSAKSVGEAMNIIKRFRHECDYTLGSEVGLKKATMKIAEAEILIGKLSRL